MLIFCNLPINHTMISKSYVIIMHFHVFYYILRLHRIMFYNFVIVSEQKKWQEKRQSQLEMYPIKVQILREDVQTRIFKYGKLIFCTDYL